ncbi:ISAon1 family transposase N-terminal region protein [Gelidibacter mesophilus]|uniref:ISAon1 family transposase N-terminal region protein n=3 Tax=Gelidibacter mesophilus TaxID=169050 RepID=UPI00316ACAEC
MFKKQALDNYLDLLKLILPEFLIDHFDLVKNTKNGEVMHLYFEERNTPPKEQTSRVLIAHGFHKEVTIQDFPLRGNTVYLHVKRRRWLDKTTKEVVQRDWNLVAQGTRMTTEFAAFLKEISRY